MLLVFMLIYYRYESNIANLTKYSPYQKMFQVQAKVYKCIIVVNICSLCYVQCLHDELLKKEQLGSHWTVRKEVFILDRYEQK
jgi:hypothetical protein